MQLPKSKKFFHRYLPIPRQLVESELASISNPELRVYLYLLHRTVGYNKLTDNPTIDQICHGIRARDGRIVDVGTGLKESAAHLAIKRLVSRGWVSVIRKHNNPNAYTISSFLRVTPVNPKSFPGVHADEPPGVHARTPEYLQETIKNVDTPHEKVVSMPRRRKAQ